jgi:hypothetical protein
MRSIHAPNLLSRGAPLANPHPGVRPDRPETNKIRRRAKVFMRPEPGGNVTTGLGAHGPTRPIRQT